MKTAVLRYNFDAMMWEAVADWHTDLTGMGDTPQEAVDNLSFQCIKHDLWPKE